MLESFLCQTRIETPYIPDRKDMLLISDEHMAKILPHWELWDENHPCPYLELFIERKQKEYEMLLRAYDAGLSVPKPQGVFNLEIRDIVKSFKTIIEPAIVPGLVMEYISGRYIDKIVSENEQKEANRQLNTQVKKAEELGFLPVNHYTFLNSIWVSKEKRLYLIDISDWRFEKQ